MGVEKTFTTMDQKSRRHKGKNNKPYKYRTENKISQIKEKNI